MATAYKTTHDNSDDATGPQAPDTGGDKMERMPLFRALPEGRPFPVEALPEPLRGAVEALSAKVECPIAIAAGSVLAAASLAAQGHADVMLPHDGGTVAPLSLFILTIADSGSRKSTADKLAMRPINDFEAELIRQHVDRREDYRIRHAAWDEASKKAKSKSGGDRSKLETSLRTLGKEPERPMDPALTVTEPTLPALEKAFRVGRPALGLFSDEGGKMLGGWSMREDNRTGTVASLNCLWDAGTIKRMRASEDTVIMQGRRLALHLMFQPILAPDILGDARSIGTGLTARLLVSQPTVEFGSRFGGKATAAHDAALVRYEQTLTALLRQPFDTAPDDERHLTPRALTFASAAKLSWKHFAGRCESRMAEGSAWETMRGWASKAPEHASRLAGIFAMMRNPDTGQITGDDFDAAVILAEYYAGEMLRLQGLAALDPELKAADAVLQWAKARGAVRFHLAEVYQFGPGCCRDRASAERACTKLADNGFVKKLESGAVIDGAPRKHAYAVLRD